MKKTFTPSLSLLKVFNKATTRVIKGSFCFILILMTLAFSGGAFAQTTIVNYDFNASPAPTTYPGLSPFSTAAGISCAASSTEAFALVTGTSCAVGPAYVANGTTPVNNALLMNNSSGTNTRYFDFTISGTSISAYKTFNIFFQPYRSAAGAQTVTVQYSKDGGAFTSFASNSYNLVTQGTYYNVNMGLLTGADNPASTLVIRFLASNASSTGTLRIDNFQVSATAVNTITTGTISPASICAGSNTNVAFTYAPAATFAAGTTTFTAQLSDNAGSFSSPTVIGSIASNASGSQPITATIPGGTAAGTGYLIRVISNSPSITGSASSAVSVSNPSNSIAPSAIQNISVLANGGLLTVTEGTTATSITSRQWSYGTVSGGPYSTNVGTGTTSFTPNFSTPGTYYVVCKSTFGTPCSNTLTSNEVRINVSAIPPTVTLTAPSSITELSAAAGGNATADGGASITAKGVVWGTAASPAVPSANSTNDGTGLGAYTSTITTPALTAQTLYYIRAYATNSASLTGYDAGSTTFRTLSNPATAGPNTMTAIGISVSAIDLNWDNSTAIFPATGATFTGYLLIRATSPQVPTLSSTNGTAPAAGVGIIVSTTITSATAVFNNAGLASNTTYNYLLVPFTWDGTNAATCNYYPAGSLSASGTTQAPSCTQPTVAVSGSGAAALSTTSLIVSWTNPAGTGDKTLVIVRAGSPVTSVPVIGTAYTGSTVYGSGFNIGSGEEVSWAASGNNFTLTNLSPATTYYFALYTYNSLGNCYLLSPYGTASATTNAVSTSFIETFEVNSPVKTSYATGNVSGDLGMWDFTDAQIGTGANDVKNGARSARLQQNGSITMLFDVTSGIGTVTVKHATYGSDVTPSQWSLDVSDDGGATFVAYNSANISTTTAPFQTAVFTVNLSSPTLRIRITKQTGGANRINIDDISFNSYSPVNTITTSPVIGSPFCINNTTGASVSVPFTATSTFFTDNVYTAELSDALGSFAVPTDIGTLTSTAISGTIAATIPAGTPTGTGYRVRVVSSNPAIIGSQNNSNLAVYLNTPDASLFYANVSSGTTLVLNWTNPVACFDEIMIVGKAGSTVLAAPSGNGIAYTANSIFSTGGSGASLPANEYAVFKSLSGNTASLSGLTQGQLYYFKIFLRKGTVWSAGVQISVTPNPVQVGDYQSVVGTKNFTGNTTWTTWDGSAWQPTATPPSGATINVTIVSGSTVVLDASRTNNPIKNLIVNSSGKIYCNDSTYSNNKYLTIYGDITCNGVIGFGPNMYDNISFNIEGNPTTISGIGTFDASRIRKNFNVNTTTSLIIGMNIGLKFAANIAGSSGTVVYNNFSGTTTFNITINANATLNIQTSVSESGNISIDGVDGQGSGERGGTLTVNGTLNVPGTLFALTDNSSNAVSYIIGANGVINCVNVCTGNTAAAAPINNGSGLATMVFRILNTGKLNMTGGLPSNLNTYDKPFSLRSNTVIPYTFVPGLGSNNTTYDFQSGSTVQYSSASGNMPVQSTGLTYWHLLISGGAVSTINSTLTALGDITILSPGTLDCQANNINVGGDWNNYNTIGFAEGTTATVTFNGSIAQGIYCPGGENFNNITISNSSAPGVQLNTDVTVANNLNLGSAGRLFFGPTPNILTLSNMAASSNTFLGSGTALVDMSGSASTFYIGCQNPGYTGTFNPGTTSLVNYNRSLFVSGVSGTQNVLTNISYADLSVSGSDAKNIAGNLTVGRDFTVDGSTTSLEATAANLTLNLGRNLTLSGNGMMGGATGTSCLNNLSITTTGNLDQLFTGDFNPVNCYNLTTNKTTANGIILDPGNSNLTIRNSLTQVNTALLSPNDDTVRIGSSWTIPGTAYFNKGTSTVEYNGTGTEIVVPINYYNLQSSNTGSRTMSNTGTIGIANIFTPGTTNTYTFTGSTVDYNGSVNQNIASFVANALVVGRTYENLTLSNSTSQKTLAGAVDVEGALTLSNSVKLILGDNYLNLKSTATKTASVAPVSATATIDYTGGTGKGRFVVERYYPARRAWRLITAPVTGDVNKTIFNSWQVGGDVPAGSGTYVSGPSETAANGLDVTPLHNYSLKTFNQTNSQFVGVANTKTSLISGIAGGVSPDNFGYFMFVRGDRTPANINAFNAGLAVNSTTLRDTGKIQIKSYTFPANTTTVGNNFTLIGNPYASPVDFASLGLSGVVNRFRAWDPYLNGASGVGGYVIVDLTSGPAVITIPYGGVTSQTQIIQSSQAFLVETNNASSPSITFNESSKSAANTNNLGLFRPIGQQPNNSNVSLLAANLYAVNMDGSISLADGTLVQFDRSFSNGIDYMDAIKFSNVNETFGISSNNNFIMLQRRKPLSVNDTIFFKLIKAAKLQYRFKFIAEHLDENNNLAGYLEDTYKHTSTPVNMYGDTWIDMQMDGNAASRSADRFRLVFKKSCAYTNIKAAVTGENIEVSWSVAEEENIGLYEIERSADGINFAKIGKQTATGNHSQTKAYNWMDEKPVSGIYYYRIKSISNNGVVGYSEIVKVLLAKGSPSLYVFPNPVINSVIQLQLNERAAGNYNVRLMNSAGLVLLTRQLVHAGGTAILNIETGNIAAGTYNLEVTEPNRQVTIIKVLASSK